MDDGSMLLLLMMMLMMMPVVTTPVVMMMMMVLVLVEAALVMAFGFPIVFPWSCHLPPFIILDSVQSPPPAQLGLVFAELDTTLSPEVQGVWVHGEFTIGLCSAFICGFYFIAFCIYISIIFNLFYRSIYFPYRT